MEEGDSISPYYDPMIAKLVVHKRDRPAAIDALFQDCSYVQCWPVRTNAWFLARLLKSAEFVAGTMTTNTINSDLENLTAPPEIIPAEAEKGAIDAVFRFAPMNPQFKTFEGLRGFRLNGAREDNVRLLLEGVPKTVPYPVGREDVVSWEGARTFVSIGDATIWFSGGFAFRTEPWRFDGGHAGGEADGAILAPMPGKVTSVEVKQGEKVAKGQRLLTLEAMKMEHGLVAPFDGVVAELNARAGAQVQVDAVLAVVKAAD